MKNKYILKPQNHQCKVTINLQQFITQIMQLDGKEVSKIVKKELSKVFNDVDFAGDFLKRSIEPKSAVSFSRYIEFFIPYSCNQQLFIDIDDSNNLTLRVNAQKNYFLSLIFKKNGVVDFLSLERSQAIITDGSSPFYLKGSIDTSGNFDDAYKIKRLLAILDSDDVKESNNIRKPPIVTYKERLDVVSNISENRDVISPLQKVLTY
ncbi:hypothetical protein B9T19_02810 [Ignatzschineria sp. F8392]|uniref:hypothetical protein n=1 Tax=Ignatzschineria sp. F8392 TaxID=1980117 RepID=UPI000B98B1BB|nr:hypothetical protein [Ignatzschineria sp. F8392]OYQ81613.1 hypothetical protein B9T19_02810 [Ignatzschineria sp. F8392]